MKIPFDRSWGLLLLLAVIEFAAIVLLPYYSLPQTLTAVLQTAAGLGLGMLLIARSFRASAPLVFSADDHRRRWLFPALAVGGFLLLLFPLALSLKQLFIAQPIDARYSDIIPTIQIAVRRFLAGEPVHPAVTFGNYTIPVLSYMPLQWLPYCFAEWLNKDYRTIAFVIWTGAVCLLVFRTTQASLWQGTLLAIAAAAMFSAILDYQPHILSMTIELMVAGYYMLLIMGLHQRNPWLKGLGIALCMLSRYSLVLWLPLWLLIEWFSNDRRQALQTMLTAALAVLLIYIIPFLSQDWTVFYRGYKQYDQSAMGEWQHLNDAGLPWHLYSGNGFAYLFYSGLSDWDLLARIKALQRTHFIASLLVVAGMGAWYFWKRHRIQDFRLLLLGTFKVYLTVFFELIQVPYAYLLVVGCFVSLAIVGERSRAIAAAED